MFRKSIHIVFIFLLGALVTFNSNAEHLHPFYVSIINIDHNPENRSLELTFKIFTDDLEQAIENSNSKKLNLATSKQDENSGQLLNDYINKHFSISLNKLDKKGELIGFESEYDVTRIYIEVKEIPSINQVDIYTDLLTEIYDDQTNIVHVDYAGETKSLLLNSKVKNGNLSWK